MGARLCSVAVDYAMGDDLGACPRLSEENGSDGREEGCLGDGMVLVLSCSWARRRDSGNVFSRVAALWEWKAAAKMFGKTCRSRSWKLACLFLVLFPKALDKAKSSDEKLVSETRRGLGCPSWRGIGMKPTKYIIITNARAAVWHWPVTSYIYIKTPESWPTVA